MRGSSHKLRPMEVGNANTVRFTAVQRPILVTSLTVQMAHVGVAADALLRSGESNLQSGDKYDAG